MREDERKIFGEKFVRAVRGGCHVGKFKNARFKSLASLRFEIAIRNARLAIRFKHSDTAKLREGLRFESAIQNRYGDFAHLRPKLITSHDVLEPLKQVLSASRDVIIAGQICGSKLERVFALGDGCWLPTLAPYRAI